MKTEDLPPPGSPEWGSLKPIRADDGAAMALGLIPMLEMVVSKACDTAEKRQRWWGHFLTAISGIAAASIGTDHAVTVLRMAAEETRKIHAAEKGAKH